MRYLDSACPTPIRIDQSLRTYDLGHLGDKQVGDIVWDIAGHKVRFGDTSLILEVERDHTHYGDECKFGGGKVIREGMGQAADVGAKDALDCVITNALVVDYTGIYKADIGIKDGLIAGIGKAGNPDVMAGVTKKMVVGVTTEVIAGEGLILTAGGLDTHIHFICPQQAHEAIAAGLTTMVGGGTGPAVGTCATTCTPAPFYFRAMLQAVDSLPLNFGFTGKGNTAMPAGLADQIKAGRFKNLGYRSNLIMYSKEVATSSTCI